MRTRQIVTLSLPPALVQQMETLRKLDDRTRSDLVREALQAYFERRLPASTPAASETGPPARNAGAFARGDPAAFARGDPVSWGQLLELFRELKPAPPRPSSKKAPKASRKKPAAR